MSLLNEFQGSEVASRAVTHQSWRLLLILAVAAALALFVASYPVDLFMGVDSCPWLLVYRWSRRKLGGRFPPPRTARAVKSLVVRVFAMPLPSCFPPKSSPA